VTQSVAAILFDLDGVITDTAEYHYQAWQALADAEGLPFDRAANEQLRGVSRRESLELILGGRQLPEPELQAWLDRKNRHYQALLANLSPADLLPGVAALLAEIRTRGLPLAIVSASHNTPFVLARLGIADLFAVVIAGPAPDAPAGKRRPKPSPDLFLLAAERLGVPPAACLVVEDAASGLLGAQAAGLVTVGLGPVARVGFADLVLPDLAGVTLDDLLAAGTWSVAEAVFAPTRLHQWESALTIGGGSICTRASFEERYPGDQPATLIHGLWDDVPIVYTELANAFDWTALDLWIDGEPFRMDRGRITDYSRRLDLRTGELRRTLRWTPDSGATVELSFRRLASLTDPHTFALRVGVTPLVRAVHVRLRARIDGCVENESYLHWRDLQEGRADNVAWLTGLTRKTGKRLATAMQLSPADAAPTALAPAAPAPHYTDAPHNPGFEYARTLDLNTTWTLDKLVSIFTSRDAADPLPAALAHAQGLAASSYPTLLAANRDAWDAFWAASDVAIDGDPLAQVAVRHGLFQLRIAAPAHDERVSIGARSLSGFGYRGHAFWDTETFILPFFTYTQPHLARNLLLYRYHTLAGARRKARSNGLQGAQFAWESAETGDEVTPRWVPGPQGEELVRIWCGDIELHITADIVYAIAQYWQVTGDDAFMQGPGSQIVLETARFWESRVEPDRPTPGLYSISDVIGPDEYHDHVDNNAYTNGLVRWHLTFAADLLAWLQTHAPTRAAELTQDLDLTPTRLAHWADIAAHLVFHRDPTTGLIEQFDGFFARTEVDWDAYAARTRSMQALLGIEGANAHQVLKQPDVLLLQVLFPTAWPPADLRANWDYYAPRTDHTYGSSLGPSIHAWAACRLGDPEEAYTHFLRAALADLDDVRGNARDGIHAASAGGLWQALVFGFGGLQLQGDAFTVSPPLEGDAFTVAPQLPRHWRRLAFRFTLRGQSHTVDLRRDPPST
jgi:kojibiose phosphorylase